jgi:hypothetical protein
MTAPKTQGIIRIRESEAVLEVKIECLRRGWRHKDLADRCQLTKESLYNQFSNGFQNERTRLLVEAALDRRFFSSPTSYHRRKALIHQFGFDPYLIEFSDLQSRMKFLGIPFYRDGKALTRSQLIKELSHQLR